MKPRRPKLQRAPQRSPGEPSYRGLWRDEKFLVIDLADFRLPLRCLKSNESVTEPIELTTLIKYAPSWSAVRELREGSQFKHLKFQIVEGHKRQTEIRFQLPIPLSPRWQWVFRCQWGTRLLWIGAVTLIATYFGFAAWGIHHPELQTLAGGLLMAAFLAVVAGATFQIARRWMLPIHRLGEGKIWIGGVHRDWLRRLPRFVPSQRMLEEEIELLQWSLGVCVLVGAFLLLLMLWSASKAPPEKPGYTYVGYAFLIGAAAAILMGNRARLLIQTARQRLQRHYPNLDRSALRKRRRRRTA